MWLLVCNVFLSMKKLGFVALEKAYRKMDEFNDEAPRAKYKKERKKVR